MSYLRAVWKDRVADLGAQYRACWGTDYNITGRVPFFSSSTDRGIRQFLGVKTAEMVPYIVCGPCRSIFNSKVRAAQIASESQTRILSNETYWRMKSKRNRQCSGCVRVIMNMRQTSETLGPCSNKHRSPVLLQNLKIGSNTLAAYGQDQALV